MPTLEAPTPTDATQQVFEETRIIRAPRSKVYEAWIKPEVIKQWFGRADTQCTAVETDVRVGGSYLIEVISSANGPAAQTGSCPPASNATGQYTKVVPNELLQFTWVPSWLPAENSLVTVSLRDAEGGTEITLRHERFIPTSTIAGYQGGWKASFDKLTSLLEA